MQGHLLFFFITKYIDVIAPLVALTIAVMRSYRFGKFRGIYFIEQCLQQLLLWVVGLESLFVFVMHTWYSGLTPTIAGWPASPILFQMAIFNLSFGVLGVASTFSSLGFRVATALGYSIWIFGAGLGHLFNIFTNNPDINNIGWILYTDISVPILIIILMMSVYQNQKSRS